MDRKGFGYKPTSSVQYQSISGGNANDHEAQTTGLDIDYALNYIGFGPFQILAFLLAGMGYVSYGLEDVTFTFVNQPIENQWNMTTLEFSVLPALTSVSNIIGALIFGSLVDLYGRVWPFSLCLGMVGIFTLASAFAGSFWIFCVLRLIVSIGTGGIPTFIFPVIMEFLPIKNRGKFSSLVKVIQMIGSCLAVGIAWWLIPTYKENGWRYFIIAISIPSFFTTVFRLVFWVQSPRFLINKGDIEGAWKVLKLMAKINMKNLNNVMSQDDLMAYYKKDQKIIDKNPCITTLSDLFKKYCSVFKGQYLRTTIVLSLIVMLSNSGDYGTTLFLPNILKALVPEQYLYFLPLAGLFARIPGVLFMSIIVEWPEVGRLRSLKLFSFMAALFLLLGGLVRTPVATSIFLLLVYFNQEPLTPVLDTYTSEVYPTGIRAIALTVTNLFSNILMIGTPFLNGYMADKATELPWLFGVVTATMYIIAFGFSFLLKKETREKQLVDTIATSSSSLEVS
jgi:putative MFS transporter